MLLVVALFLPLILADESTHTYKKGDAVFLWVNKVGPFNNPTETYYYYDSHVPFCKRAMQFDIDHAELHWDKSDGFGSLLEGNNLVHSGLPIKFRSQQKKVADCTLTLTHETSKELHRAIVEKYWYRMYLDDLPLWGMVGEMLTKTDDTSSHHHDQDLDLITDEESHDVSQTKRYPHVFTHKAFSISYNGNRIIEVNLTSESPVVVEALKEGESQNIEMTYSVDWSPTKTPFPRRFDRYLDFQFFEHQIHWFALFNSFMMVIFLVGLVTLILMRLLKKDYERYESNESDLEYHKIIEETGWKKLHGEVFRSPEYLPVFSAIIGTGYQVYFSFLLVILLALSGKLYDTRGSIAAAVVLTYAASSIVAGYTSAQTFMEYGGADNSDWKITMALTGLLFPSIIFSIWVVLNFLSVTYRVTNAMSLWTFLTMTVIWLLSLVLLLVGTLIGRNTFKGADFPCEVHQTYARPVPTDRPWYMQPVIFCSMAGILPFGSIFIEMYYILNSFWNYKFYYVYGFMLLVFLILTIVTICVTIVAIYFLLNSEDHRWQWISLFSGGSTALHVFLYATFYFHTKTQMNGLFQTAYYFGYMFLFSLAIFFMCGAIGYIGTSMFVRRIYDIKIA